MDLVLYRRDSKKSLKGVADRIWARSITYRVYAAFVKVISAIVWFAAKTALVVTKIAAFLGLVPLFMLFRQKSKHISFIAAIVLPVLSVHLA